MSIQSPADSVHHEDDGPPVVTRQVSFGVIAAHVIRDDRLTASARLLYAILATYADGDRASFPRAKVLAENLGASAETVRVRLRELESAGYLRSEPNYRDDGSRRANTYVLVDLVPSPGRVQPPPPSGSGGPPVHGGSAPRASGSKNKTREQDQRTTPVVAGATQGDEGLFEVEDRHLSVVEEEPLAAVARRRKGELIRAWCEGWTAERGEQPPASRVKAVGRNAGTVIKDDRLHEVPEGRWRSQMLAGARTAGERGFVGIASWLYPTRAPKPVVEAHPADEWRRRNWGHG